MSHDGQTFIVALSLNISSSRRLLHFFFFLVNFATFFCSHQTRGKKIRRISGNFVSIFLQIQKYQDFYLFRQNFVFIVEWIGDSFLNSRYDDARREFLGSLRADDDARIARVGYFYFGRVKEHKWEKSEKERESQRRRVKTRGKGEGGKRRSSSWASDLFGLRIGKDRRRRRRPTRQVKQNSTVSRYPRPTSSPFPLIFRANEKDRLRLYCQFQNYHSEFNWILYSSRLWF